jgi:hypothetical protein
MPCGASRFVASLCQASPGQARTYLVEDELRAIAGHIRPISARGSPVAITKTPKIRRRGWKAIAPNPAVFSRLGSEDGPAQQR